MALIESYVDSGLGVIILNDSENGNKLNNSSLMNLNKIFSSIITNNEVRAVLIRSNGDNFCLGMDLDFLQASEGDKELCHDSVGLYTSLLLMIYGAAKPVIALVNGNVKAGGVGLMAACDIILASEKSTIELSEVFFGLIPANVLPFIYSLRLSPQKARYLILTAKKINAQEGHKLNLIDEVFSEDKLERGAKGIIKNLFRAAPHAIAETKHFTRDIALKELDESLSMAKEKLLDIIDNPEVIEAVTAFNEGSMPSWFGRFRPEKPLV